jgi:diphthamide biosynthesis protein 3
VSEGYIAHNTAYTPSTMASYYDEVEVSSSHSKSDKSMKLIVIQIEDMEFDEENLLFHSPCPCGDRFEISLVSSSLVLYRLPATNCDTQAQLQEGEDIARCPSCSLIIRVIYDPVKKFIGVLLTSKDDFVDDDKGDDKETAPTAVEVAA